MKPSLLLAAIALALATAVAAPARAQGSAPPLVVALVVTNNRSAELGRPELQYADDDGAKYYEVFRMLAGPDDVELLTDFDRDSARLFPELVGLTREPTRAAVDAATERVAARARAAEAQGRRVDFYFVFAGHGDVERGKGFLELRDGRLESNDIEAMVKRVGATRAHVILDSCNSFFVVSPRRAGGRRVAVTEEAARSLSDRLPNVGVLLSTSAEAEVFEWSELQSGIFSHAVRSGLLGAADADGDGKVTYDEIRGFLDIAGADVENPLYRPKVFARGPNGRGDEPIFDLTAARAVVVKLDAPERRVTVRDAQELPWIDVHKEAGVAMALRVPKDRATGASVDERDPRSPASAIVQRHPIDAAEGTSPLSTSATEAAPLAARGPNDVLARLFASPYGPKALAQWEEKAAHEEPPVYGISTEDAERMRLLLYEVADSQKQQRQAGGALMLAVGAGLAVGGIWMLSDQGLPLQDPTSLGGSLLIEGGAFTVAGVLSLLVPRSGEHLYADYQHAMADPAADGARVVAETEERLLQVADTTRTIRQIAAPLGWTVAVGSAGFFAAEEAGDSNGRRRLELGVTAGAVGFAGVLIGSMASMQSPVERIVDLWTSDPALQRLPREPRLHVDLGFAPLPGGGSLGLSGKF
jgi:hypothetical protein